MALYLVQHGKSLPKEQDPARGLSETGISEVEQMAADAARQKISVSQIIHSGKKRALQTAEIYARALQPGKGVMETDGLAPLDDVRLIAKAMNSGDNLMAVGHLPFMERLVSYLVTGTIDQPVIKFRNGGIVCLDVDPAADSWVITWTMFPTNS
jgi:phosphohistidine phosphatase